MWKWQIEAFLGTVHKLAVRRSLPHSVLASVHRRQQLIVLFPSFGSPIPFVSCCVKIGFYFRNIIKANETLKNKALIVSSSSYNQTGGFSINCVLTGTIKRKEDKYFTFTEKSVEIIKNLNILVHDGHYN
jgi:hypothetical protein